MLFLGHRVPVSFLDRRIDLPEGNFCSRIWSALTYNCNSKQAVLHRRRSSFIQKHDCKYTAAYIKDKHFNLLYQMFILCVWILKQFNTFLSFLCGHFYSIFFYLLLIFIIQFHRLWDFSYSPPQISSPPHPN